MKKTEDNKLKLSFGEYDFIEEVNEAISEEAKNPKGDTTRTVFYAKDHYPTVAEMKAHKIEENLGYYLPYLMFYYTQPLATKDKGYAESMKHIHDIMQKHLEFTD